MNVILIGYRGSGKTSLGRKLANQLWKDFVDVDQRVREHFDGATIAEIWQARGEAAFREAETAVTRELCQGDDQVIALGGGTLMQPQARQAVADAQAIRIYLCCDPAELYRRIHSDPATAGARPALTDQGGGLEEIERVLAEREPVYRAVADAEFDVTHTNIDEAARHIIQRFL